MAYVVLAALVIAGIGYLFQKYINNKLWQRSVQEVMESNRQGVTTLQVQLKEKNQRLKGAARGIEQMTDQEQIAHAVVHYNVLANMVVYFENGNFYPKRASKDKTAEETVVGKEREGIVNPHINSATGVKVFDMYVPFTTKDGLRGWLVEEVPVNQMMEDFAISFHGDKGFSYVVDTEGQILMRSINLNSNLTVNNLFDAIDPLHVHGRGKEKLQNALQTGKIGWAVMPFEKKSSLLVYCPVEQDSDWHMISLIDKEEVNKNASQILAATAILIVALVTLVTALLHIMLWQRGRADKQMVKHWKYTDHLFNAVSEGMALVTPGTPYYFVSMNEAAKHISGQWGKRKVVGGAFLDEIYLEDREQTEKIFSIAANEGKRIPFAFRILDSDGKIVPVTGCVEKNIDYNGKTVLLLRYGPVAGNSDPGRIEGKKPLSQYGRRRVLVADDNVLTREMLKNMMEKMGITVETAVNGQDTLDKVKTQTGNYYDLILMDIHLPVMNGYETAYQIRSLDRMDAKTIPIIAMSTDDLSKSPETISLTGMNDCLSKPFGKEKLQELMDRYLTVF